MSSRSSALSAVRLDIPGNSCRVHRNESQELLRSSRLSHLVCRRRDWDGTLGSWTAHWDLGPGYLCRAGDLGWSSAHAIFRAAIVAGKLFALSKCAWL